MTPDTLDPKQSNKPSPSQYDAQGLNLAIYSPGYDGMHRADTRVDLPKLVLSQADYERFRVFVRERIGLDVTEDRINIMARALSESMQASNSSNLDELHRYLNLCSNTSRVWDRLVSTLTVGETYFFRNTGHFDAMVRNIFPQLLTDREHSSRRIRVWSAGCSTGEEPYSVAILLSELVPNLDSWNISIMATDINREALQKAQDGLYGAWSFRGVEKRVQDKYFRLTSQKQYAISDKIKQMVKFDYFNLVSDPYPSLANNTNAMDVILCRNVTIYFRPEVTRRVLGNFYACLTDNGWLIPGAAEPNMIFYEEFVPKNFPGAVVYQRPASPKQKSSLPSIFQQATSPAPAPVAPPVAKPSVVPTPAPVKTPPAPKVRDPFEVANELLQAGKADEALVKLYEKLDQDANYVPTYYTLGKIYANKGNLEEAQTWCERAIKRDKLHPEPYFTLSLVYQQIGLADMAMDALKKTIYLDRSFVMAHYNLAHLQQSQGDHGSARKEFQNALALLKDKPKDYMIPEGDGLIASRLIEIIENALAVNKA